MLSRGLNASNRVGTLLGLSARDFLSSRGECVAMSWIGMASRPHTSSSSSSARGKTVKINWKLKDGSVLPVDANIGWTFLDVAHKFEIDLEGACAGVCACSTCHLIFEDDVFDGLPEASETEDDMLDQAFQLTHTSRLGCQVLVQEHHEGITVQLPMATRNFYVDGHVPKPH